MNQLTREQKLYVVAGAHVLFVLGLFLKWAGADGAAADAANQLGIDTSASGFDSLPSGWLWLALGLLVAAVFAADAAGIDLPSPILNEKTAAAASFAILATVASVLFEAEGLKFGFWISLIGAVVGFAGAILAVRGRLD